MQCMDSRMFLDHADVFLQLSDERTCLDWVVDGCRELFYDTGRERYRWSVDASGLGIGEVLHRTSNCFGRLGLCGVGTPAAHCIWIRWHRVHPRATSVAPPLNL